MSLDTARRVAIVTGAARGIGAAVAERLASDGYAIGVLDLDEADCAPTLAAVRAVGGTAVAVSVDVSDEVSVGQGIGQVVDGLGPPTVLVNNAGIAEASNLVDMTTAQWDSVLGTNLRGSFFVARAVVPYMITAGWGRIVTISSVSALGDSGRIGYASAKAGLLGFTKTLALELGGHGVTANAVAPGFVVSDMTAATAHRLGRDVAEHQRLAAQSIPVGRVGQPEDIAHAVSFLSSPQSGFVSGQVLYVAGGPVG